MNPCWKSTRSTVNALDYLHEHSWYQRWRNQENIKLGRENSGGLCQDLGTCSTPTNVDVKGTFLLLCFLYTTLYFNYSSITYSLQSRILWHIAQTKTPNTKYMLSEYSGKILKRKSMMVCPRCACTRCPCPRCPCPSWPCPRWPKVAKVCPRWPITGGRKGKPSCIVAPASSSCNQARTNAFKQTQI